MLVSDKRLVARAEIGDTWAHVARIRLSADEVDEAVDEVHSVMRRTGAVIASWWLSERSTPADLEERLLRRGLVIVEGDYLVDGMVLTGEPPPVPAGIEARQVASIAELAAATALSYEVFEMPPEQRRRLADDEFARLGVTDLERVYGAWIDGQLAGTGRAYFTPVGASLAGGATAQWARGKGAYRALVRARWDDAAARDTPALAVHAKDMSAPILARLGFEKVVQFRRLEDVASPT